MSVINKMLRELDQRHAMSAPLENAAPKDVRPVRKAGRGQEWFWRVIAALMLAAVGWMGWVFYQIQPRAVATDAGITAGERVRRVSAPKAAETPATRTPPEPQAIAEKPAAEPPAESLRLAQSIGTPITDRPAPEKPADRSQESPAEKPAAMIKPAAAPATAVAASRKEPALLGSGAVKLERREITPTSAQRAEAEFRRGAGFLQQGRVSEAEDRFQAAIALQPAHGSARQALAALLIDHRRLEDARKLLQEGLALDPAQVQFATALARILVERGDYPGAAEVLNSARKTGRGTAEFNAMLGSVLQRLGRHREAVEAYHSAVGMSPENGAAWMGYAISLEMIEHREDAVEAYRRALASGTLAPDIRTYAEQKLRQLR